MKNLLQKILLAALALCLTFGVLTACGETEQPPKNVTYVVNVSGADDLEGVKVNLAKGGTTAAESALTNGKATFELAEDTYTATVKGLPAGYSCSPESATLTASAPTASFTVSAAAAKTFSAEVTVKLPDGNAAAGVEVQAIDSKSFANVATTNAQGVASFTLEAGSYTVNIDAMKADGTANWPKGFRFVGEQKLTVAEGGANTLAVSLEAAPVRYTVTVVYAASEDVNGDTIAEAPAVGLSISILDDKGSVGDGKTDESGLAIFDLPEGNYTVRISEYSDVYGIPEDADLTLGGEKTALTVSLETLYTAGTRNNPFELKLGANTVKVAPEIIGSGVCFAVTSGETALYSLKSDSETASINLEVVPGGISGTEEAVFELASGQRYLIYIDNSDLTGKQFTVTFAAATPKTAAGSGSAADPYRLGEYGWYRVEKTSVFTYAATAAGSWRIRFTNESASVSFDGTDYKVDSSVYERVVPFSAEGAQTFTFNFTVTDGAAYYFCFEAYEQGGNVPGAEGTIENPIVREALEGDYEVEIKKDGTGEQALMILVYYSFTPAEDTSYTITSSDTNLWFTMYEKVPVTEENDLGLEQVFTFGNEANASKTFTLEGGKTYVFSVETYDETQTDTVDFKIVKN